MRAISSSTEAFLYNSFSLDLLLDGSFTDLTRTIGAKDICLYGDTYGIFATFSTGSLRSYPNLRSLLVTEGRVPVESETI